MFGPAWTDISAGWLCEALSFHVSSVRLDAIQLQNVYNDLTPRKQLCHG